MWQGQEAEGETVERQDGGEEREGGRRTGEGREAGENQEALMVPEDTDKGGGCRGEPVVGDGRHASLVAGGNLCRQMTGDARHASRAPNPPHATSALRK